MATTVQQVASECPCHVFDVTEYNNKLYLADVRAIVKSRTFYKVPIFVIGEGVHSNRKESMKNRVYSCVNPSETKQFRLTGSNGSTIYMNVSKSLSNHELVHRYRKMRQVDRSKMIEDIIRSFKARHVQADSRKLDAPEGSPSRHLEVDCDSCHKHDISPPPGLSDSPVEAQVSQSMPDYNLKATDQQNKNVQFGETVTTAETAPAFPTDSRERAKVKEKSDKEKGIVREIKKVKKYVEEHFDDCGEDLSCLLKDDPTVTFLTNETDEFMPYDVDKLFVSVRAPMSKVMYRGCSRTPEHTSNAVQCSDLVDMDTFITELGSPPIELDLSKSNEVLCCCHLGNDNEIYLITDIDLSRATDLEQLEKIVARHEIALLALVSPPGAMQSRAIGRMCRAQLNGQSYFFCQHQNPDAMTIDEPWTSLIADSTVTTNECLTSEGCCACVSNLPGIMTCLQKTGSILYQEGGWSDELSKTLALYSQHVCVDSSYPIEESSSIPSFSSKGPEQISDEAADPTAVPPAFHKCPGCKNRRSRYDSDHTRVDGECRYPYDETEKLKCPGCLNRRTKYNRHHISHNNVFGECKWADSQVRTSTKRIRGAGRLRASVEPTSSEPATKDGQELGAEYEQPLEGTDAERVAKEVESEQQKFDESHQPHDFDHGPKRPDNWTNFDISNVLMGLRQAPDLGQRQILRKLHVRWWHAAASQMDTILRQAGVPTEILSKIPSIVDTCKACRKWNRPAPDAQTSASVSDEFNVNVEADIVFYHNIPILSMIDRCTRWHSAEILSSREYENILTLIDKWVGLHGPMKYLHFDHETAIWRSFNVGAYFQRNGITLKPRAPNQHARYIEKRNDILKQALRRIDTQLEEENIQLPLSERLSQAVFAGNALLSINGSTPYNAVYGRVPLLLPDYNQYHDPKDELGATPKQMGLRNTQRLREMAIQAMVEGSAAARINHALRSKTQAPQQLADLKVGDLVEFYRRPNTKDACGWFGPAKVSSVLGKLDGHIDVKWQGRHLCCRHGDVRRYVAFTMCLLAKESPSMRTALDLVQARIGKLCPNTYQYIKLGDDVPAFPKDLRTAIRMVAHQKFNLFGCHSVRLIKGLHSLKPYNNATRAMIIWWKQGNDHEFFHLDHDPHQTVSLRHHFPDDWTQILGIQFLMSDYDDESDQEKTPGLAKEKTVPESESGKGESLPMARSSEPRDISTPGTSDFATPEGTSGYQTPLNCFIHEDMNPELLQACLIATKACMADVDEYVPDNSEEDCDKMLYDHWTCTNKDNWEVQEYYNYVTANVLAGLSPNTDLPGEPHYFDVEYGCHDNLLRLPRSLVDGEIAVLRIFLNTNAKKAVIERGTDILTKDEELKNRAAIRSAILQELKTWAKYKCFSRKKRNQSRNIIDSRFVFKWKYEKINDGTKRRIIRARMVIRGFKDKDKESLDSYAGTSKKYSQRIVASVAASNGWPIGTADISKAFLQGVTYEELHEITGETLREVNFTLPYGEDVIACSRQVEGFENFDPKTEVLHCDKPGTGSVDAPRAFSLKLASVTQGKCDLQPTTNDEELCLKHCRKTGKLLVIMTKHVDDLKIAGETKEEVLKVMNMLSEAFGPVEVDWHDFTNCGVRHIQDPRDMSITLDQCAYIDALKVIEHPSLKNMQSDADLTEELFELYRSLLGAAAFALLTRADVAVFVVALQRMSSKAKVIHIKRLNVVVRYMQRNHRKIRYARLHGPTALVAVSDSAFKKEDESGHALKGGLFILAEAKYRSGEAAQGHLLDYVCSRERHVTRSTFGAELFGACDSADTAMHLVCLLHQIKCGSMAPAKARTLREEGGWSVEVDLALDAMSVFAATTATQVKIPAEKALLSHVQYLRELLDRKILTRMLWFDTRDMWSDGLTKGAIEREPLHDIMSGKLVLKHEHKEWSSKVSNTKFAAAHLQGGYDFERTASLVCNIHPL